MCIFETGNHMRTTIDIPADLRKRLMDEASDRNLRGFSQVIVDALHAYFNRAGKSRDDIVGLLQGCLAAKQMEEERQRLRELRGNWKT
jgi:hypothetical protein